MQNTVSDKSELTRGWYPDSRPPWYVDPEKAAETFPDRRDTDIIRKVRHRYKGVYHSVPYHKEWDFLPSEVLLRIEPPNPRLVTETLSQFIQAVIGVPGLEHAAASQFLNGLTWPTQPGHEELAAVAVALDHILASNGGVGGTLTVARTATGFDFERRPREPVYFRFEKGVAETNVSVPRYPDADDRTDARSWFTDLGLLRASRRIQSCATDPPVEIELALDSGGLTGDLDIGLEIRDETTLDDLYREQ